MLILVLLVFGSFVLRGAEESEPASLALLDAESLSEELARIVEEQPGEYGIYLKVLETGEALVLNDVEFPAASCFKLPLTLMIYEAAADGRMNLDSKITLQKSDWEAGTGVLQATKAGTQFTMRRLVELAVVESDNIAANMLLRTVGRSTLTEYYRDCGAKVVFDSDNRSTPEDMGIFAERLIKFAQEQGDLGRELFSFFLESKFKDRLALGLPEGVKIANKIGTLPGVVNDVSVVIGDDVTYVLAMMSKQVGATDNGRRTMKLASMAVHRHLSQKANDHSPKATAIGRQILEGMDY